MNEKIYGLMAEFNSPGEVLRAAEKVQSAGFRRWDVFTPFPISGLDEVMGHNNSPVGRFAFVAAAGAFLLTFGLIWFGNTLDYPLIVGGKPMFSVPVVLVSAFIMLILGGAIGALAGLFVLAPLPRLHHPLLGNARFAHASRDKFFIVIGANDPKFSMIETRQLLESIGGAPIEIVEDPD
jgi:hypothetical protein